MSLNKTLDRLFDEIRREAKRNPDFANRLDAVLRAHESRREVPDDVVAEVTREPEAAAAEKPPVAPAKPAPRPAPRAAKPEGNGASALNPVGLFIREGEAALVAALEDQGLPALQALVREHNLDPGGVADALDRDALAAHVIAQARRRAERDKKLFDY